MTRIKKILPLALCALALLFGPLAPGDARAAWPDHTITIIVPFPPGGPNDLLGRLLAAELAPKLGQSVIVENRAGAVGNIGLTFGARAAPDGYTLVVVTGVVLINPSVTKVAYDPLKDFAPIAYLGAAPNAIITRPASGIASIADLIAKAKANPGKLTYASPGVGSVSQLAVELLKLRAGIDMTHVPFPGAAPSLQAALAGTTDIASVSIAGLVNYIRSGQLKALAQTGSEHWVDLPDVPTMAEAGVPNAVVETSQMFLAPTGTPPDVIKRLADETRVILAKPDIKDKMLKAGFLVKFEGPDELKARMAREVPVWKEIVERAGVAKK
ncbi:MAG TPA: tripartite tricarboxylate transporter substrate binding protein [Pseudolabrys sp.]|jgi:tripartite-type tricarboxylate transporter receptor subunit TctC|nr:tripartite tricarboxylate transporter substrate binding protein [Pseudolabrys sp.]